MTPTIGSGPWFPGTKHECKDGRLGCLRMSAIVTTFGRCAGNSAALGWNRASTLNYGRRVMYRVLNLFVTCHLLFLGTARADDGESPRTIASAAWHATTEKEWFVVELGGRPVLNGTSIKIVFHIDGRVSGNAGTNKYKGAYKRTGPNGLKVSNLGATKMYMDLPPGRMQQETRYLEALKSIDRYTLEDDELSLWVGLDRSIRYTVAH
jgi:heat shock protein HslJ